MIYTRQAHFELQEFFEQVALYHEDVIAGLKSQPETNDQENYRAILLKEIQAVIMELEFIRYDLIKGRVPTKGRGIFQGTINQKF